MQHRIRFKHIALLVLLTSVVALTVSKGLPNSLPHESSPPIALASGLCGSPTTCIGTQHGLVSLTVRHDMAASAALVEVDDTAETFDLTVYWKTEEDDPNCTTCDQITSQVSADVDWNPITKAWNLTCTGCDSTNGPIYRVWVCDRNPDCTPAQPIAYQLVAEADLTATVDCDGGPATGYLDRGLWETTSLSQGYQITQECTDTGRHLSTVYGSYSTNDNGAFECFTSIAQCYSIGAPELSITY